MEFHQKKTVMIEYLKEIKEELFDAPSEVKEAFNTVVSYFDDKEDLYYGVYLGYEDDRFHRIRGPKTLEEFKKLKKTEDYKNTDMTVFKKESDREELMKYSQSQNPHPGKIQELLFRGKIIS